MSQAHDEKKKFFIDPDRLQDGAGEENWEDDELLSCEFEKNWREAWEKKRRSGLKESAQDKEVPLKPLRTVPQRIPPRAASTSKNIPKARFAYAGPVFVQRTGAILLLLAVLYCTAVFSDIPFISKWRAIYIETAMGTLNHHWLATAFIPKGVIDRVMEENRNLDLLQKDINSDWKISPYLSADLYRPWNKLKIQFLNFYPEIDSKSFSAFLSKNESRYMTKEGFLLIDQSGLKDGGTDIKTVHGHEVLAVDTENGVSIVKITQDNYVARLAIIKDPSRIFVGVSESFGNHGEVLGEIARQNGAVLAVNASGFYDPNGKGNGGAPFGLVKSNGNLLNKAVGDGYKTIGFDEKNRLLTGGPELAESLRDGVEFKPILILDGKKLVEGSAGWGIQPRTVIGQTRRGEVLLLVIDGRAPGYSIGATISQAADILQTYGAVLAINLDGGSSSLLYYRGREISRPSAANKEIGRRIPDGFLLSNRQ